MTDQQLSFLSTEPSAFDVNAVDDGIILPALSRHGSAASHLAQSSVDDWVFGLGFTNWKSVIDHALRSGHYELYASEDGCHGLRKHGYRYAPIPRLPVGGVCYILQRLLVISAARIADRARHEKMITVTSEFAHKSVIEAGVCDLTIKQGCLVIRACVQVEDLGFDDSRIECSQLAGQLLRILSNAGAQNGHLLAKGCKSLANHLVRMATGVR
uniref:Uncharacterized protein n=1 Tax=Pseudomonas fluorescens (strain SBW25) TaxID=216595 RepID=A0A0G4E3Z4_PSEFS|nr:hypothetical protein [Pseudomonas fluorescens]CEK41976.1 hypothetical protein PQBR57_0023 [Pseudomonas fluorescens SBW25]